jgi:hypothetical protein
MAPPAGSGDESPTTSNNPAAIPAATPASPPQAGPAPAPRTLAGLAAATPATRSRAVDLSRAAAIVLVVIGHWLVIGVWVVDGSLRGENVLALAAWAHPLTWVFQVMPIVFLAGGFANSASWQSWRQRPGAAPAGGWVAARARRLLVPTAAFVGAVSAGVAVASAAGVDPETIDQGAWLVGIALWFLAAYLVVTALTPLAVATAGRIGSLRLVLVLVGLVAGLDIGRFGLGLDHLAQANHLIVWLAITQLGIAWHAGELGRRAARLLALAGIGGAALLVALGPYPLSMIGVAGAEVHNTAPPTLALALYGAGIAALVVALAPWLERVASRRRVWLATVAVNAHAMTIYLWHLVPVALAAVVALLPGWFPNAVPVTAEWLATRPAWVALLAVILVLLVLAAGPFERRARTGRSDVAHRNPVLVMGAVAAASLSLVMLTVGGLSGPGPLGLATTQLILLAAALLVVLFPRSTRTRGTS